MEVSVFIQWLNIYSSVQRSSQRPVYYSIYIYILVLEINLTANVILMECYNIYQLLLI